MHTDIRGQKQFYVRNQAGAGLCLACAWFNNFAKNSLCVGIIRCNSMEECNAITRQKTFCD